MAENEKTQSEGQLQATRTLEPVNQNQIQEALDLLENEDGYQFIFNTVDDSEQLNPEQEAIKEIFLTEAENKNERRKLKNRMQYWVNLLESESNAGDMIEKSQSISSNAEQNLNANLKKALDATAVLESNYRAMADFFRNAGGDKPLKNVTFINASIEQTGDLDDPKVLETVSKELTDKYDRLDLMNNYGIIVIPGFIGNKAKLDEWARRAYDNKAMLVTDFRNLSSVDQVMKLWEQGKYTGGEAFRSNVLMSCNWLVGREAVEEAGEKEPLFVPPSGALAGLIYSNNISQVSAGKKFGALRGALGSRFIIRANDLSDLADMGLVPTVFEYGQVQAMSSKTLFNGANIGLQTYSVVRTFDWLTKAMIDYLNRMLFTNISVNLEMDVNKEISRFLTKCQREYNIIENFGAVTVKRDPNQKDRVLVSANIKPYFPAKNFIIKLDGRAGDDGGEWNSSVE
ncbi:MAG: type VI secretion system contractile sheath protein TssC [Chitinophagales bacterium]|nr:type VI secretion system contractile sheath protein TssC [Chitinophagales bacterium]